MDVFNRLGLSGPVSCIQNLPCSKLQQGRFHNMNRFFSLSKPAISCRNRRVFLSAAWVSGLLLGVMISAAAGKFLASLMRALVYSDMSIVGLLCVAFLPFLITAIAVYFRNFTLLHATVFCRAFLCAYTAAGMLITFRTAGWLICLLYLSCDCLQLPLLWLCWLGASCWERAVVLRRCVICAAVAGLVSVFNFCMISPFLAELISF